MRHRFGMVCICLLQTVCIVRAQEMCPDSLEMYMDSLFRELPEVIVRGERPIVKAEAGKLVYDMPRLIGDLPVENAYDAIKQLPGIVDMGEGLQLAGQQVNVVIDGKVSTLSVAQLNELLKSMPASRLSSAEVMFAAPARYQVRGPVVNIVLEKGARSSSSLKGELYSSWNQKHYETLQERASLLYQNQSFSTDLLYSYTYRRSLFETEKEAVHTLSDGSVHPLEMYNRRTGKGHVHNIRWGMDYSLPRNQQLSLVYSSQLSDHSSRECSRGDELSDVSSGGNSYMHHVKADYRSWFGLSAGAEYTFYRSPGHQTLSSVLENEQLDLYSENEQRIHLRRVYTGQEHTLSKGWKLNYGVSYQDVTDRSFQYYYDPQSGDFLSDASAKNRREEKTFNGYVGVGANLGEKAFLDASLVAEYYHTAVWNEWSVYPTLNFSYLPAAGHILQFSLSTNKSYPPYWSVQDVTSYMGAYSEIRGNPLLKPSAGYRTRLSYILKSKYVFTGFFNYTKDRFLQLLYQSPERLTEIYKYMNLDFEQTVGVQATVPVRAGRWMQSRFTLTGMYMHQKDSDFWDLSFNRRLYTFVATVQNTFILSAKPDLKFTLNGCYQNRAIQGNYDLPRSGNLNADRRWTFAAEKVKLTLQGEDLFDTSGISPRIRFGNQQVINRYIHTNRAFILSLSYKFGDYKEKRREAVDTSRFK
ncbi:MAG: outer membrane beta-barrel family protein [Bacteroides sp.]|nr:outer membrane beta-barrel family protein [Bacteroides sp.]